MTHVRPESTNGSTLRRGRPTGWLFGLLVMCFAVLPHLTLAATMMRMPGPAHHGASKPTHLGERTHAPIPCHEGGDRTVPASAAPPCCIIGCGLIAEAPAAPILRVRISWSRLPPVQVAMDQGRSTEPAERPPRSARFA
jgi:hypothetical protein